MKILIIIFSPINKKVLLFSILETPPTIISLEIFSLSLFKVFSKLSRTILFLPEYRPLIFSPVKFICIFGLFRKMMKSRHISLPTEVETVHSHPLLK